MTNRKTTPAKKKTAKRSATTKPGTITVFSYGGDAGGGGSDAFEEDNLLDGRLGLFGFAQRRAQVSAETLQNNLKSFLASMETAMDGLPKILSGYSLDEIELSLEVGAEGEIGLLGTGGKLSGKGSISLKLKRSTAK